MRRGFKSNNPIDSDSDGDGYSPTPVTPATRSHPLRVPANQAEETPRMMIDDLITAAEDAQDRAHAPYSGFNVGAALRTADGTVYTACNVEAKPSANTLHAEARAMAKAVEDGHEDFDALALVTSSNDLLPPCGNCRQTLATFQEDLPIFVAGDAGRAQFRLKHLLPNAYTGRKMEDAPTEG